MCIVFGSRNDVPSECRDTVFIVESYETHIVCGKNAKLLTVTGGGTSSYHCALKRMFWKVFWYQQADIGKCSINAFCTSINTLLCTDRNIDTVNRVY